MIFRFFPVAAAVLTIGIGSGADPVCKYLADANAKVYTIPTHIYQTQTAAFTGDVARSSELIYLNDKTYIQVNGKWRLSPMTQKSMREMRKQTEDEELKDTACRLVRNEAVGGVAAALYSVHQKTADETVDTQIWISKSQGLPLKLEMDTDTGGKSGKSHKTMRYEYTNIQPPTVSQ